MLLGDVQTNEELLGVLFYTLCNFHVRIVCKNGVFYRVLYGKSITSRGPIRLLNLKELCTNDSLKLLGTHLMAKCINLLKIKTSVIRKCVVEPKSPDNGGSTVLSCVLCQCACIVRARGSVRNYTHAHYL